MDDFPSALIKLEGREKCRPPSLPILFCVNLTAKQDWLDPPHSLFYFVPRERDWYGGYPGDGKSRRINFSLWRCVPMAQYAPKLVFTHAKEQVYSVCSLAIIFLVYNDLYLSKHLSSWAAAARWRGGDGCLLPATHQNGRSTISNVSGNCFLSMFWGSFEFLQCTGAGDLILTSDPDLIDHTADIKD